MKQVDHRNAIPKARWNYLLEYNRLQHDYKEIQQVFGRCFRFYALNLFEITILLCYILTNREVSLQRGVL